jgi:ABC-type transport system substrate-binding protein
VLQLAQKQLRRAGVEVRLTFAPGGAFFGQIVPNGEFDAALFAWLGSGGFVLPYALCGDSENFAGYCSRLVTRDAKQVDVIVDPQQRARILHAVDAKLARAVPVLPVVQPVMRAAIRTTVRGVVPGGTQFNFTQNSENWWLAEQR